MFVAYHVPFVPSLFVQIRITLFFVNDLEFEGCELWACVGMNIIFVTLNSLVWEMSADFDKKKSFDQFRFVDIVYIG